MIKINNDNINDFFLGNDNIVKAYYGVCGTSRLPQGYTEVEYIENQASAYINTNFNNTLSTEYVLDFQVTSGIEEDRKIIGSGCRFGLGQEYGYWRIVEKSNSWYRTTLSTDTNRHIAHSDNGKTYMDDTLIANRLKYKSASDYPMLLFAVSNACSNQPTPDGNCSLMKMYSCQIYDDGTLIRDFVPCVRDNDSKVGAYDIVNDVFYSTASNDEFVAGNPVYHTTSIYCYQKLVSGSPTPPTPPTPHDYSNDYLTFVAEDNNVTFTLYGGVSSNVFQYSLDSGSTWNNLQIKQTTPSINNGDKILFKASNLSVGTETGIGTIRPSSSASVEGNIMSLIYGDNFSGQTNIPNNFQFRKLFSGATNLTSAENIIIPATSLRKQCYSQMFQGCTSLSKTPNTIGSSTINWNVGDYVMSDMFHGCTSLTTVSPNLLPALNLTTACYWYMFEDCSSLTASPILAASTSSSYCYRGMFKNCSSLKTVTCLLTTNQTFTEWLSGVAENGTFYKDSNAAWSSGNNGIPSSWTVEYYNI